MTTGDGAAGEGWYFSLEYPAHYLVGASIMQSRDLLLPLTAVNHLTRSGYIRSLIARFRTVRC